jgi:hypothetical protein
MKTLFSVGFQSHDPFTLRHPSFAGSPSLGRVIPLRQAAFMGQETTEFEHLRVAEAETNSDTRDQLAKVIAAGTPKLAAYRTWIAGVAAKDPTLLSTFKEQYIVDNIHGYEDIINTDQASVDMAARKIASPDPQNWFFSEDMVQRVNEWNQVLDIMMAAMKEYGGVRPVTTGPVKMGPMTNPKTGTPYPTTIAPGATVRMPPPAASIGGIPTNTLLVGGGIAAAAIAVILAMRA